MDEQFEVKTCSHNIFAKQTCFGGFGNGTAQIHCRFDIFATQEDVATVSFQRKRGDKHTFHQQVRQLLHQQAVFIGARLHFISVTQQVTDVHGFVFRHQAPLQARREACAAAPFQASIFHLVDDLVRRQPGQRFTCPFVTVFAAVFVQPHWLFVIAQTPGQRMRFGSTDNVFHLYRSSSSGIASGVRCA